MHLLGTVTEPPYHKQLSQPLSGKDYLLASDHSETGITDLTEGEEFPTYY